jgi:hypothetical protein
MCFELRHVFIVSGPNISPIPLPLRGTTDNFEDVTARVSGWGWTSERKCVDTFNSYSTDKELLLHSQYHVDLIEVKQQYII